MLGLSRLFPPTLKELANHPDKNGVDDDVDVEGGGHSKLITRTRVCSQDGLKRGSLSQGALTHSHNSQCIDRLPLIMFLEIFDELLLQKSGH